MVPNTQRNFAVSELIVPAKPLCQQEQNSYIVTYPQAIRFAEDQAKIAWPPKEIPVESDIQEFLTAADESDKHALITVLKLFTRYELLAGNEYWGSRIAKKFPRVCIQRMANAFANAELNMHAPFYNELNKALNLDTEEFYTSYVDDPTLNSRINHIEEIINSDDDLLSLGAFSMVEGAILYSSFAYLKHYRVGGKNRFKNAVSGINFSVRDENLHAEGGAWLFGVLKKEMLELGLLTQEKLEIIEQKLLEVAMKLYEHECRIIQMFFEKGPIKGITDTQLEHFAQSRLNLCLKKLGIKPLFKVTYNPIADWFYDNINAIRLHDFFDVSGSQYHREWIMDKFNASWGEE